MPEPLWKIRTRKGLSISKLAAKSGVPAISIQEYESGHAVRSADLPKLAKALYVEEWDIDIKGSAKPKSEPNYPPRPKPQAPKPADKPKPKKVPPAQVQVKPSQIQHLLTLAVHQFGKDQATLEKEIGKPLETLTRREASKWLAHYQKILTEMRTTTNPSSDEPTDALAKRKRAYLPESVDGFELQYLTSKQEAQALLHFVLFNGERQSGRIIGFSPYSITIKDAETDQEVTVQKLAIAYYRSEPTESTEGV